MTVVRMDHMQNGITNQPPFRTQPGQVKVCHNLNLDITGKARTRNGTDILAQLTSISPNLDYGDVYFTNFRGDTIVIGDSFIRCFDENMNELAVHTPAGFGYIASITKADIRTTIERNTVIILNRTVTTATKSSATYTIDGTVTQWSDLPTDANVGTHYRCQLSDGGLPAGIYQRILEDNGQKGWRWVAEPNQANASIDASTMPHALTKANDGSYTFEPIEWTDRRSGDDGTNPRMPWFGYKLEDICFHSSRIFFLANGSITASSSRDTTLLYLYEVRTASDVSNPISRDVGVPGVGKFLYSASIGGELFIACENGQLLFTSGQEQLTNINGVDVQIGTFPTQAVMPAADGVGVLLLDNYNTIHEFGYDGQSGSVRYLGDINSHALKIMQGYAAVQMFRFGGTTFIPATDGTNARIFYHEKSVDGGTVIQTGWGTFDINPASYYQYQSIVVYMFQWNDAIRIIVRHIQGGWYALKYIHKNENNSLAYPIALDYRYLSSGVYHTETDTTRFNYPYSYIIPTVVTTGDKPEILSVVAQTTSYVEVKGNYNNRQCYIGQEYSNYMELLKFWAGASSIRPTISSMTAFYDNSICFDVEALRAGNDIGKVWHFQTTQAGVDNVDASAIKTGCKTFNLLLDGRTGTIRIRGRGPVPMAICALEFNIRFTDKIGVR